MGGRLLRLHATISIPLEDLTQLLDDIELPAGLAGVDWRRESRKLHLAAIPSDPASKYTPTAMLVGDVETKRIQDPDYTPPQDTPAWEREDPPTIEIETVTFTGHLGDVLRNREHQAAMFEVLCQIALGGEGELTAIHLEEDDGLACTRLVDGAAVDAHVEVVDEVEEADSGVEWTKNPLIN